MVKENRNIHRHVLPNGLTVITEEMSHIRSVSVGIWLKTGSRDEDSEWNGISHFIEHMVFKGTKHRSAEDIARQVEWLKSQKMLKEQVQGETALDRRYVVALPGK